MHAGGTPLHYACRVSNGYVAELLLKEGADLRAKDSDRLTPIYQVCPFSLSSLCVCLCVVSCRVYKPPPSLTVIVLGVALVRLRSLATTK
jgi:hypothetical protein